MSNMYEGLSLVELRKIAKEKGLKNVTIMRKQELIDKLSAIDEPEAAPTVEKKEVQENDTQSAAQDKNTYRSEKKVTESKPEKRRSEIKRTPTTKDEGRQEVNKDAYTNQREYVRRDENTNTKPYGKREEGTGPRDFTRREETAGPRDFTRREESSTPRTYVRRDETTGAREFVKREENVKNDESRGYGVPSDIEQLDSGETKEGILEVLPDGYGFIRCDNYLPGENDVYVSPAQIRRFNLKTGDIVVGNTRIRNQNEKFSALLYVKSVNGFHPSEAMHRKKFEDLTPIFPNERIHLEIPGGGVGLRMVDLISPIGKGQRGMIVSQPKAGKTTLLKQVAKAITTNHPNMNLIILLIDERPEEVTDIKESIEGNNVEVIYSTFDELPENHKRVSEMVIERARRLVEHQKDVVILLDSITRLARAYNLTVQASGRTLSGGLDPAALYMPKKFFGAARNMREGGSLTILATALVDTGSRMDDVVFEEFKGTGNMELVLDRNLSERRIFPAIDLPKSSTRRDDLLLTQSELEANYLMRKALNSMRSDEAVERIIDLFVKTKNNKEFVEMIKKVKLI